jgi:hypothetical protein
MAEHFGAAQPDLGRRRMHLTLRAKNLGPADPDVDRRPRRFDRLSRWKTAFFDPYVALA